MKKLLLLGIAFAAGTYGVIAQSYGDMIGSTYYDLQSNSASGNRIDRNETNGYISVVWTFSNTNANQPASDRGVGYNFWDGMSWIYAVPGTKISSVYCGWPEIASLPGGGEYTIQHTPLKTTNRGTTGFGAWSATADLNYDKDYCGTGVDGTWPRMVRTGNYLHSIVTHVNDNQDNSCMPYTNAGRPFLYSRSSNGGLTWDITNVVMPGISDTTQWPFATSFGGDQYAIAANGNTVVITSGGFGEPWLVWKSTDAGVTWTMKHIKGANKHVIDQAISGSGDWFKYASDEYLSAVVDDQGYAHIFVGRTGINLDPNFAYGNSYYPATDGVLYWSDKHTGMCEPMLIAELVDIDGDGDPLSGMNTSSLPLYYNSLTSMTNAAVDANGNLYVIYAMTVEGTNPNAASGQDFRDLYIVWSNDGGLSWSEEISLYSLDPSYFDDGSKGTSFEEDVFPSVVHRIGTDNKLHITWQLDYEPGLHVRGDADAVANNVMMYYGLDLTNLPTFVAKRTFTPQLNMVDTSLITFTDNSNGTATIDVSATFNDFGKRWTVDGNYVVIDTLGAGYVETVPFSGTSQNYTIKFEFDNSCPDLTYVVTGNGNVINGIKDEVKEVDFTIFPNPAKNEVTIDLTTVENVRAISIMNTFGQLVENISVTESKAVMLNTSNYAEGMYFVRVSTASGMSVSKLEIKK